MNENPSLSVQEALGKLQILKQMTGMPGQAGLPGGALPLAVPGIMPGASGQPPSQPLGGALSANPVAASATLQQSSKAQREVYVTPMPPECTAQQLKDFVTYVMQELGLGSSSQPVSHAWLSSDGRVGFVELKSADDAEALIDECDGIDFAGVKLTLGRPKAAVDDENAGLGAADPTLAAAAAPLVASSQTLMLLNIPKHLEPSEIQDALVLPFGELVSFNVLTDANGASKGSAVFRYKDETKTSTAIAALSGVRLGDEVLEVQRVPPQMVDTLLKPVKPGEVGPVKPYDASRPSPVLCIANIVDDHDLTDDQAYADLTEDILEECARYATVDKIVVPRPKDGGGLTRTNRKTCSGLGRIFVSYADSDDATKALKGLRARTVDDKPIHVLFYPNDLYKKRTLHADPLPILNDQLPAANDDNNAVETSADVAEPAGPPPILGLTPAPPPAPALVLPAITAGAPPPAPPVRAPPLAPPPTVLDMDMD